MWLVPLSFYLPSRRCLVNGINQPPQQVRVRGREHTMSEIENMPSAIIRTLQHIIYTLLYNIPGGQQKCGIEIALDTPVVADTCPGLVQVNTPIDADNITASSGHYLQEA